LKRFKEEFDTIEMDEIDRATSFFRQGCFPDDDCYFDLRQAIVRHQDQWDLDTAVFDQKSFRISTHDGYRIQIMKMNMSHIWPVCWFNGYFTIPSWKFVLCDLVERSPNYEDVQQILGNVVELTYGSGLTFGWDHGHSHDLNFYHPPSNQNDRLISGPVQVLEEALQCIEHLRKYEQKILLQKKKNMTCTIYQELMEKTLHPNRVQQWVMAGMDI